MTSSLGARVARLEQRSTATDTTALVERVEALLEQLQADGQLLADGFGFPTNQGLPVISPKPRGETNPYDLCVWLVHREAGHAATRPGGVCLTCQPSISD